MDVFRVKQKFLDSDSESWWGDHTDVRFFLLKRLKKLRDVRVLAVGCNCGVLLSEIENSVDAYGFDINEEYVKNAKTIAPKSKTRVATMYKLPYKSDFFDAVVTAEQVPNGKPAPDIFLEAARRMNIDPQFCHVFEDGDSGIEAAQNAGMTVTDIRLWQK